jgi:hypothetical protein
LVAIVVAIAAFSSRNKHGMNVFIVSSSTLESVSKTLRFEIDESYFVSLTFVDGIVSKLGMGIENLKDNNLKVGKKSLEDV